MSEQKPRIDRLFAATALVAGLLAGGQVLADAATAESALSSNDNRQPVALDAAGAPLSSPDFATIEPSRAEDASDLLAAMRSNFRLEPIMNAQVESELNWYLKHPDYLQRVFTRAQRYLPHIVGEIQDRDLPLELALLPIVESAFDPFAYSHGRAAGLWQIIPGTGTRFGLEQNWWYDGRRDVVDSTRAALDYLTYLNELMDGDWLLAVASYNSGEGNVLRAVKRNRKQSKPTDFWNLKLPRETQAYVPRLMALAAILRDPSAHGITLPAVRDEPQFSVVDTEGQLDLALAADLAGIDLDTLSGFNAGLNQWATDPAGPHRLVLPADAAAGFQEALAGVPMQERVRWKRHKVRSGETLSEIAEDYDTTFNAIRTANSLSGSTIRAGHFLMIPAASEPLSAYVKSADARRDKIQNKPRNGSRVEHVVKAGESFWSIGRHYGVGTRELAAWNAMAPRDTLSIGQTLVVWTKQAPTAEAATTNSLTRKLHYTVRSGDSLSRIASRFRVRVADIARWNAIDTQKILRPGQKMTLYVDVRRQSS